LGEQADRCAALQKRDSPKIEKPGNPHKHTQGFPTHGGVAQLGGQAIRCAAPQKRDSPKIEKPGNPYKHRAFQHMGAWRSWERELNVYDNMNN
jgi:hypothetical protein